jgi:class 3 adenylate cyclase
MELIRFELVYELDASVDRIWLILADTERMNRQIGLPPADAKAKRDEPVRVARVKAKMFGVPVEWDEEPFDWIENRFYWERRRILGGPIKEFNGGLAFEPLPEGRTRVRVQSEFLPANAAGQLIVKGILSKTKADFDRAIAGIRSHLKGDAPKPYGAGVDTPPEPERKAIAARLEQADPSLKREPLASKLFEFLANTGDPELFRIRPFTLARQWGVDRYAVLRLCLLATRSQVLNLSWDLLCPNCGGAKNRWTRLEDVRDESHCDDCQITYNADFDRAVEVTFRPNPRFRNVDGLVYCAGGPRNTPHIVAQCVLAIGERRELVIPLSPGRYRLRNLTASHQSWLTVEEQGPSSVSAIYTPKALELDGDEVAAGEVRFCLENGTATRQQPILERLDWAEDCATAAQVTVYQEFRDLFGSEVLSPDTQLSIRTLPLVFTDLKGSTALYGRLGDASAYALVRDHFAMLQRIVARHGGGLVKTIGDAVMAGFPTAAAAMACVLDIHRDLEEFNRTATEPVRLKIGLHQGPCIAVRSYDERLDYFGSAVNLAARTHEQSLGDDIVTTDAILQDPEVEALLTGVTREAFTVDLRGLGEQRLWRLRP